MPTPTDSLEDTRTLSRHAVILLMLDAMPESGAVIGMPDEDLESAIEELQSADLMDTSQFLTTKAECFVETILHLNLPGTAWFDTNHILSQPFQTDLT